MAVEEYFNLNMDATEMKIPILRTEELEDFLSSDGERDCLVGCN